MYYPYVRGRQYELLALKELLLTSSLSPKIVPIIEPVKLSPTLIKTIALFIERDHPVCVIINPCVGSFNSELEDYGKRELKEHFIKLLKNKLISKTFILKKDSIHNLSDWNTLYQVENKDWYVININRESISSFSEVFKEDLPQLVFIPDESAFRRSSGRNRALIEDRFERMSRNSDYSDNEDEFFSEDHLYYTEDGFKAFSDYSIVGSDYLESGFAPYAVAIHIVYFDSEKKLRVHHFVSNSNRDIQNPAGKFYEAVTKLAKWVDSGNHIHTKSLEVFLTHYKKETYPGLGSVKKLSLMHHLELIGMYFDEVQ